MTSERANIGILGGSFDPVHIGHLMLADYLTQFTHLDQVWLMLSPLNPLKAGIAHPASDAHRMAMLEIATSHTHGVATCDIELTMPRPSYSINSLRALAERYPQYRFSLVIGSDNWLAFDRWKDYQAIIREFHPTVYPRPGYPVDADSLPPEVTFVQAPTIDISSTFIRQAIARGHDMTSFLPHGVWPYITTHNLYR